MFRTRFSVWDAVAVAAVVLAAVVLTVIPLMRTDTASVLVVTTPEGSSEYALSESRELTLTSRGVTLHITVANGEVYVSHSDCPDSVCVASGRICRAGETILCAPAGVTLTVKGGGEDVDFVAG